MWQNIVSWLLGFFSNINTFVRFLFTPLNELPTLDFEGSGVILTPVNWLSNLLPNIRGIDVLSVGVLSLFILLWIWKKVW